VTPASFLTISGSPSPMRNVASRLTIQLLMNLLQQFLEVSNRIRIVLQGCRFERLNDGGGADIDADRHEQ
jgi:hypothetical protein